MPKKGTTKKTPKRRTVRRLGAWTEDEFTLVEETRKAEGYATLSDFINARTLQKRSRHNPNTKKLDQLLLIVSGGFRNLNQIAKHANTMQDVPTLQTLDEIKKELLEAAQHIKEMRKNEQGDDR